MPAVVLPRQPTPPELPPALPPAQIAVVLQAADAAASPQPPSPDVEFISSITSGQKQLCNDPLTESDLDFLKMVSTFGMDAEAEEANQVSAAAAAAAAADKAAADLAEAEQAAGNLPSKVGALKKAIQSAAAAATASAELPSAPVFKKAQGFKEKSFRCHPDDTKKETEKWA